MAQLEPLKEQINNAGACLLYVAAEKRNGMFKPEAYLQEHPVTFPFLLDEDRAVTKAFGVYHSLGVDAYNIAHPATFIVGKAGKVTYAYVGRSQHDRAPIDDVLRNVRVEGRDPKLA